MKNLGSYFENPFTDIRIARDRKQAYGEDHLQRLAVQNTSGQFDDMISETETVQTALFGGITSLDTLNALREARTRSVNRIMKAFTTRNSKLNAYFIANGNNEEDVYIEFFPQGVQAFTRDVTKENIEAKIEAMITAITNNTEVAGGANVLKEYQAFKTNYTKARGDQQSKTGQISSGITNLNDAETAWDDQMFSNILVLANMNRNKPENMILYLNQQLLENDEHHTTTLTGKIKGTMTDGNGHPLKNVLIHVLDGKVDNAHSDENGTYETHPLPIGKWQVEWSKGNKKVVKEVEIKEGDVLVIDVVLM